MRQIFNKFRTYNLDDTDLAQMCACLLLQPVQLPQFSTPPSVAALHLRIVAALRLQLTLKPQINPDQLINVLKQLSNVVHYMADTIHDMRRYKHLMNLDSRFMELFNFSKPVQEPQMQQAQPPQPQQVANAHNIPNGINGDIANGH